MLKTSQGRTILVLYAVGVLLIAIGAWFSVGDGPVSGAGHIALFVVGTFIMGVGKFISLGRDEARADERE